MPPSKKRQTATKRLTNRRRQTPPVPHHHVYVVELDPAVLSEKLFREANSSRDAAKACLYVGMTGLTPDERFANHKSGKKAARFVRKYGLHLRRRLYSKEGNPMSYEAAKVKEVELAERLREAGYAVWQR